MITERQIDTMLVVVLVLCAAIAFLLGFRVGINHRPEQTKLAELVYPALPQEYYNVQPLIHQIEAYQQQGKIEESMNQPSAEVTP